MTARPKQILLWAATGLTWLGAFVGGPTLLVFPFFIPLIIKDWSTPSGLDFVALSLFALLWFAALLWIGLRHHGKARWAHFLVAGAITAMVYVPGLGARPTDDTAQLYRAL
jgi:hypothetical protein